MAVRSRSTTSLWTDINLEYDTQRAEHAQLLGIHGPDELLLAPTLRTGTFVPLRHLAEIQDGPIRQQNPGLNSKTRHCSNSAGSAPRGSQGRVVGETEREASLLNVVLRRTMREAAQS